MELTVTEEAEHFLKEEWGFESGDCVKLYVRYGGNSTIQSSFSLGIAKEQPRDMALSVVQDGITFFMEQDDVWYVNDKDLIVDYSDRKDEIIFNVE